jgi:hypothetical protein
MDSLLNAGSSADHSPNSLVPHHELGCQGSSTTSCFLPVCFLQRIFNDVESGCVLRCSKIAFRCHPEFKRSGRILWSVALPPPQPKDCGLHRHMSIAWARCGQAHPSPSHNQLLSFRGNLPSGFRDKDTTISSRRERWLRVFQTGC